MRKLVYYIATTLDGFIAREDGSFSDFPWDDRFLSVLQSKFPETFPVHLRPGQAERSGNRRFDAVLMGRKTYEVGLREGITSPYPTLDQYLFSRTLGASPDPAVTLVSGNAVETVARLKEAPGKAVWICGGGELASTLFQANLVDEVIIKLNPILFGNGIPLLRRQVPTIRLSLKHSHRYRSGHMLLEYSVRK